MGRRKFYAKFGWLSTYQSELDSYADLVSIVQTVETQIKTAGLNRQSFLTWSQAMTTHLLTERGQKLKQKVSDYLAFEANQIPAGEILLGTSEGK